jgi:hypothetical protein
MRLGHLALLIGGVLLLAAVLLARAPDERRTSTSR